MSERLPNGVLVAIATTYGATKTVTGVTNANPAVATTSAAHGITTGGIIEVTTGWSKLNAAVVRAASAAGSSLAYEGIDTTDTGLFPAGTGGGSIREITAFTQISQVLTITTSGGEQQFYTFSYMEDDFERQLATQTSPVSYTLELGDDPTLPGYIALKAAAASRQTRALKMTLPGGSILLYNGTLSLNETPKMNKNEIMTVTATFSIKGPPIRY